MGKNKNKKQKANKAMEMANKPADAAVDESLNAINEYLEETLGDPEVKQTIESENNESSDTVDVEYDLPEEETKQPENLEDTFIASFDSKFMTWKTYNKSGYPRTGDLVVPKEYKSSFTRKQSVLVKLTDELHFKSKIAILNSSWSIHVPIKLTAAVQEYFDKHEHIEVYSAV